MSAQRAILQTVNRRTHTEELFGLSVKAIDRWISVNQLSPNSRLASLIRAASAKLFFLANKSQEQITEEYKSVAREISRLQGMIQQELDQPRLTDV
jgi:hypothetical protein